MNKKKPVRTCDFTKNLMIIFEIFLFVFLITTLIIPCIPHRMAVHIYIYAVILCVYDNIV